MKFLHKLVFFSYLLISTLTSFANSTAEVIPGEYLIKFKPGIASASFYNLGKTVYSFRNLPQLYHQKFSEKEAELFVSLASETIEYIEPVYKVSIVNTAESKRNSLRTQQNYDFSKQWALENPKDTDININQAWAYTQGNPQVIVAVIDSGVDYRHPELASQMWVNPGEIAGNGIDDDGNGYVDDVQGWNFGDKTSDPFDDNGHGTHCAGIIAASGQKVWGAAPKISIMPLKFLSARGYGSTADAISAIDYAVSMGAKVLSNSWGGAGYSKALEDAIEMAKSKNVLVVAAAGNSSEDISIHKLYPAALNLDNMLTVANLTESGELHYSSSYSKELVDLAAPGTSIYSTYPDRARATLTGTSMAAPYVSAAAALLFSLNKNLNYQEVKSYILANVKTLSSLVGKVKTSGTLNAGAALHALMGGGTPPPPPPPPPKEEPGDGGDEEYFKAEAIQLEKKIYRKWYNVHYRLLLSLVSETEDLTKIQKVVYYYKKDDSEKSVSSSNVSNSFYVKIKAKDPEQKIKIEIIDKKGKTHTIYR